MEATSSPAKRAFSTCAKVRSPASAEGTALYRSVEAQPTNNSWAATRMAVTRPMRTGCLTGIRGGRPDAEQFAKPNVLVQRVQAGWRRCWHPQCQTPMQATGPKHDA